MICDYENYDIFYQLSLLFLTYVASFMFFNTIFCSFYGVRNIFNSICILFYCCKLGGNAIHHIYMVNFLAGRHDPPAATGNTL